MGKLKLSENDGIHSIYNVDAESNYNMVRRSMQIEWYCFHMILFDSHN